MSTLCERCSALFSGQWKPRVDEIEDEADSEGDNADSTSIGDIGHKIPEQSDDELDDGVDEEIDIDLEDPQFDNDTDFYENPRWLHRNDKFSEFQPFLHHSIPTIESFAAQGCHLCNLLLDRLLRYRTGHEKPDGEIGPMVKEKPPRLIGVASVQPYDETSEMPAGNLCLEISYFVDGDSSRPASYFQSIDFTLMPAEGAYLTFDHENDLSEAIREPTLSVISSWVQHCRSTHDECNSAASSTSPRMTTRLLQIVPHEHSTPFVKLVKGSSLPTGTEYVTLSHCWGNTSMPALRNANETLFLKDIPWRYLTKTFRDAILYTQRLGVQYLWIDAFCINQDDVVDWFEEALAMASIFSNVVLNIAATASPNGDGGLFLANNQYLANGCIIEAEWEGLPKGRCVVFDDARWSRRVEESVLNHRAWVLQERWLSPRTIHFGDDQVSWECIRMRGSESWPEGMPIEHFVLKPGALAAFESMKQVDQGTEELNGNWLTIVSRYSECLLTKESDKLIALAGLAQVVQQLMRCQPSDYVAGLWKPFLLQDLLWRAESTCERYNTYQAPSWSWSSVNGAIVWNPSGARAADVEDFVAELRGVEVQRVDERRPFGAVISCWIEMISQLYRVQLGPMALPAATSPPALQYVTVNGQRFLDNDAMAEVLDDERVYTQLQHWLKTHTAYFCHFATVLSRTGDGVWVTDGLLLERDLSTEKGLFRRFGWLRLFHEEMEQGFDGFCVATSVLGEQEYREYDNSSGYYTFRVV